MEFVCAGVKRPSQSDPHLEGLSSADDEVFAVVEVCVVLRAVLIRFAFHQVDGDHFKDKRCGKKANTRYSSRFD